MQNIILAALTLLPYDAVNLKNYCQHKIDQCSYTITHTNEKNKIERKYLEGKMSAYEDILLVITKPYYSNPE